MRSSVLLLLALSTSALPAQNPAIQKQLADFKQSLAANQQARRQYTWLESTQIAYQGAVKTTKLSDCSYVGANPKPTCTELTLQQAPLSGGFIRKHIEEKKRAELQAYMDSVRTLIGEYVPLNSALIDKAYQSGNVWVSTDPVAGTDKITIKNYRQSGDSVTITLTAATKKLQWVNVGTWLNQKSATVAFSVQFAALPNGVSYAARKNLTAAAAGVAVTVTSSDFAEAVRP